MGFLDRFKKGTKQPKAEPKQVDVQKSKVEKEKPKVSGQKSKGKQSAKPLGSARVKQEVKGKELKGKTAQAYRILVKPLITEKASDLGALNKYVFAINPKMNKVEVKKAIRTIYNVTPVKVNISNFSGKKVRYGRVQGQTTGWKKAVITLKAGDKIEVYEGV